MQTQRGRYCFGGAVGMFISQKQAEKVAESQRGQLERHFLHSEESKGELI